MPKNLSIDPHLDTDWTQPPGSKSNSIMENESGRLGVTNPSPAFAPEHNLPPSALGGDNRTDLGLFAAYGNPSPGTVMGSGDSIAELPLQTATTNPKRSQVAGWFRGGGAYKVQGYKDCDVL